jgi:flagellar motility protein MotE (MotC chaperone)
MKSAAALVLLACLSLSAQAGLNKWVDEDGKVHYSDSPPAGAQVESVRNISGKGQESAPADYSSKNYSQREAELNKARQQKKEATEKSAREAAQQQERKQNCAAARENLRALESGTRLVTYDENGEKRFLDDAERTQRMNSAREAVKGNCD